MKRIENFVLPEHHNNLYKEEAISSIALARDVASKINEIVDELNELSKSNLEKTQEQDGKIRKGILYMKGNLLNTMNDLMVQLRDSGFIDDRIEFHCENLKSRLDNLLGSVSEGSTSGDAELIDLRLDAFDLSHKNAGASIRNAFEVLLDRCKNFYLDSIGFYEMFTNHSYSGDEAYNRLGNLEYLNLDYDFKVSAPVGYNVSVTIWNDADVKQYDSGWLQEVILPKNFNAKLGVRKEDNSAILTSDIHKLSFEIDSFDVDVLNISEGLSYTSGGYFNVTRLCSGFFAPEKMVNVVAPDGFSVALKIYKEKGGKNNFYKDTGWTDSVTCPIGYVCELNIKKNDDSQIYKSDLSGFTFRTGLWNDKYFSVINESIAKDILNSVTYGGWTTETHTYLDTTFSRMVSGVFISDKTLRIKSRNPNVKVALHLWKTDSLGTENFISASGWMNDTIIPANRYFTLYICGEDSTLARMSDVEFFTITEYEESEIVSGSATFDNVKSIAHMGYSMEAPENTLSAYKLAYERGFKYVECDVHFTSDGIGVLLHDDTIDRTSSGSGSIANMTLSEVRSYDFGSWFGGAFVGEVIPTFEEFILLCRNYGLHPYIEIKYGATKQNVLSLYDTVCKLGMRGKVSWISFEDEYLQWVYEADPLERIGYIVDNVTQENLDKVLEFLTFESIAEVNEVFIDCNYANVTDETISLCFENAVPLEVWTVDDESTIKNMNPYVSGFTSNYLHAGNVLKK